MAPVPLTVSCCWSYDNDTCAWVRPVKGVSLAGSHARRDGWMEPTPLCGEQGRGDFETWSQLDCFPDLRVRRG